MGEVQWVDAIAQLATAGGFAALVWYLVIKHIPEIERRHREERAEWREFMASRDLALQGVLDRMRESQERLEKLILRVVTRAGRESTAQREDTGAAESCG